MAKLSVEKREKLKEKDGLRKKKERKRKKSEKAKESGSQNRFVASTSQLLSPQSLGKAVHRVKSSLPKSPKKVLVVISKIVEDLHQESKKQFLKLVAILVKERSLTVLKGSGLILLRKKMSETVVSTI